MTNGSPVIYGNPLNVGLRIPARIYLKCEAI